MSECKCNLHHQLAGDGCEICNPARALEFAEKTIEEQKEAMKEAASIIIEMCRVFNIPYPVATLSRRVSWERLNADVDDL